MSDNALSSQGVTIEVGDVGSPADYAVVPEVMSINGPSGSASIIDVTDLSSTAKEKVMGLMDEGQVQMDVNYIPTNAVHEELRAARAAKTLKRFRIAFTSTPTVYFEFDAYVTGFQVSNAVDAVTKVAVTLEISGPVSKQGG